MLLGLQCVPEIQEIPEDLMLGRTPFTKEVIRQIEEYLHGERREFQIDYRISGTEFQKKVWNVLKDIPYGSTMNYGEVAEEIGKPGAARAVGMANNKNPLHLIIPCHRVIGKDGSLTGYAGGLPMKQYVLSIEQTNS